MLTALSESRRGDHVRLERVTEQIEIDLDSLSYLSAHGFVPGTEGDRVVPGSRRDPHPGPGAALDRARADAGPAAVRDRGLTAG